MNIAIFSTKSYDKAFFEKFAPPGEHKLTFFDAPLNSDTANLASGYEVACVFVNDKIDKLTLERLASAGIRLIVLRCAGFNNIDLEAAKMHSIRIMRVPAYAPEAIAEHAVALILTLNRKTHKAYNRIRESNFSLENLVGFNLHGKTVGVVGTGKTGAAFCKIMLGFGCKVLAMDVVESQPLKALGIAYTSYEEILKQSDIISLHCPLTPETLHLVNKDAFAKMKDGVMLINTSRGAVIDTREAIQALKSGKLGYLGLDVYEQEENLFFKDLSESIIQDEVIGRLMSFPNVLITAHQGFFTKEALEEIVLTTFKNIEDFEKGIVSANEVK